jgi:hypothetical protein
MSTMVERTSPSPRGRGEGFAERMFREASEAGVRGALKVELDPDTPPHPVALARLDLSPLAGRGGCP